MRIISVDCGDGWGMRKLRVLAIFPLREGEKEIKVAWLLTPWGGILAELEQFAGEEYAVLRANVHAEDPRDLGSRFILSALEILTQKHGIDVVCKQLESHDIWIDFAYLNDSPIMSEVEKLLGAGGPHAQS
jgi:hypothetical protein